MNGRYFWNKLVDRFQRLCLTIVSKQWVVFGIATALLIYGFIGAEVWSFQACFIIGANVFQKYKGVGDTPKAYLGDTQSKEVE